MYKYNHGKRCGQCHDGVCNVGKVEDDVWEQQCNKNCGLYKNNVCISSDFCQVYLTIVELRRTADLGCSRVPTVAVVN